MQAKRKNLVIVGSGPNGMVAALLLKDRFESVTILERQSKENFLNPRGVTFPIVFSPASIRILKRVNAWEKILSEKSEFFGVVIHKQLFGKEFAFTTTRDGVYSHWRTHIVSKLFSRVEEEKIPVYFDAQVEDIDFKANICTEALLGGLPFDLLLGTDGINSSTRKMLSKAHPEFREEDFSLKTLEDWYAYSLPATGLLGEKFLGGEKFYSSNVYIDNLPQYPKDKFRVVTTGMREPKPEISVLIKHDPKISMSRLRMLNESFFGPLLEDKNQIMKMWEHGHAGKFGQVFAPTFYLENVLLIGDSAHGFESTGDLINLGVTSIAAFENILNQESDLATALKIYDDTVGESLRYFAKFSLRRTNERIGFEVFSIELASRLGLAGRHPALFGIYDDDFDLHPYIQAYKLDKIKGGLLVLGIPIILSVALFLLNL